MVLKCECDTHFAEDGRQAGMKGLDLCMLVTSQATTMLSGTVTSVFIITH